MKTNRIAKFVAAIIIPAVLLSSVFVNNARAMSDSGKATVINKSMIQAFIKCYDDYFKDELSSINDWTGIGSIKNSTSFTSWNNDDKPLPTDFTTINDDDLRCSEVIEGYHPGIGSQDIYGVFDRTGHSIPSATDKTGAASWLVDYAGYRQGNVTDNPVCVKFNFHRGTEQSYYLSTICAEGVDSDGRIVGNIYTGKDGFDQDFDDLTRVENDEVSFWEGGKGDFMKTDQLYLFILDTVSIYDDEWQQVKYIEPSGNMVGKKWEDFLIEVRDALAENHILTEEHTYSLDTTQYYVQTTSDATANFTKDRNSKYSAAYKLLGMSGPSTQDDVTRAAALTLNEQVELYREYLASIYSAVIDCNPLPGATGTDIKWFENGSTALKTCKINSSRTGGTVNGLDSNRWFVKGTTYQNIIDFFNGLPDDTTLDAPASTVDPSSPITPVDPIPYDPSNPNSPETTDVNCYTNAGAIGWILCPITESGGKFVQEIYDKFIEPQLVLDSGLLNRDNQGGEQTYEAWQTFRNLANIAFVAVFLFVIFSQLTGFGIDNYGIKKILPKMIVAAIIVNVSYFICQIAIDLANIVGYGIKNIMATVGTVPESSQFAIYESGHTLSAIKADLGIAALVGALVVPAVLGQGVGILISVFTAVIGIVIAILTLFVVLAARKTLSLVLVVISPLAFLCYMLPNTKKLFNKWLDALKGTLLAFPICAGMVFGGQAVSRIVMLSSSNVNGTPFFMTLIAAATAVAPIFLIPSVLKKSMGAISGVIDRASHGVSRLGKSRWQGSQSARRLKEAGAAYQEEREVNRAKRALYGGKFSKGLMGKKELSRRQALAVRKHARTLNAYDKGTAEAYETIMESAGLEKAQDVLSGTSDVNASIAALGKINGIDAKETENELRKYTSSDAFYNLSAADQMKFANACRDMKDNPMAQAYGKLLATKIGRDGRATKANADNYSYEGMDNSGALNDKIRGLDNNALVNANKDIFKGNDLSRFSAEQIKTAAVSHFSGDKLTEFNKAVASMSEERRMEVLSKITGGTEWSNMRSDTLEALGGKEIIDKMRASGAYAGMETGIKGLENAQELHASTDSDVLTTLGITPGAKAEAAVKAQADAIADAVAKGMAKSNGNNNNGPSFEDKYGPYKPGGNY